MKNNIFLIYITNMTNNNETINKNEIFIYYYFKKNIKYFS